ncbi:MAG TPA: DUF302 domain-containing protein [Acidobacteriaceae bacterium]|jgi:uncharacterized protein (DUF302 family)
MNNGIRSVTTHQPVDAVVQRLTTLLHEKNIKLFALIDHSGEADAAGFHMPTTKLLIFGNPKAGTPVMISAPSAALDLPLKILISQEPDGTSVLSWNDPAWLQQRHNFPPELTANLAAVEALAHQAAQ